MRVLIYAPNWLGDMVMALPALASVRRHFPSDTLAVAAPASLAPLFSAVPDVDLVVPLEEEAGGKSRRWVWRAQARVIASGRFDVVILFPNSFHAAWVAKRAGVPERWGYRADLRGWLLTKTIPRKRRRSREVRHQAEYYQDLVRALGIDPVPVEPRITVSPQVRARATEFLEQHGCGSEAVIIGIAPGAAYGHAKRWPSDRFADLIAMLRQERGATCVLVGSAGDRDAGYAIESSLGSNAGAGSTSRARPTGPPANRVNVANMVSMPSVPNVPSMPNMVNLIGRTDLLELVGVLASCRAVVSNDSGAMHVAAALGVPVTAVFGPTDERATRPLGNHQVLTNPVWCRPCMLRECPIDHRCMKRVSARRIFEALSAQLQGTTSLTSPWPSA